MKTHTLGLYYETSFIALNFYRSGRGDDQWIFHDEMDTSIILCTKLGHLTVKICSRLELPSISMYYKKRQEYFLKYLSICLGSLHRMIFCSAEFLLIFLNFVIVTVYLSMHLISKILKLKIFFPLNTVFLHNPSKNTSSK